MSRNPDLTLFIHTLFSFEVSFLIDNLIIKFVDIKASHVFHVGMLPVIFIYCM